jgi:DNA-directed RNA polymerase specialized sigma subunit
LDEPSSVERLWEEFKLKASADARERLILHYAPLVKYVAGRVSVGLPPNIEQADLVSYGIFGLIDAIEKYEGLTLAEIGQVLGVTESRVCQMHTKAVLQLRAKMQDAR